MGYRPKDFGLQELVSPEIYEARGERAWELLDERALMMLQSFRDYFGKLTVNDYEWGGSFKYSGLRPQVPPPKCGTKWNWWSQHCWGRGFDSKPKEVSVREMYDAILARPERFPMVRAIENIKDTPTWIHADVRAHMKSGVWIINAK